MSVKVSLSIALETFKKFPKLMIATDGLIVFFMKESYGTVIKSEFDVNWEPGEYSEKWAMDCFKDFEGEITLKNE
jgi:hypothetical protein